MKFPFIRRSEHQKIVDGIVKRTVAETENLRFRNDQISQELRATKRLLDEAMSKTIPAIVRTSIEMPDQVYPRYRIAVEFDSSWVESGLVWGGGDAMLEYVAEKMARQIKNKLEEINFVRYRDAK